MQLRFESEAPEPLLACPRALAPSCSPASIAFVPSCPQVAATRRPFERTLLVLSLFKLRIGVLITLTALVGYVATPGHAASAAQVLALTLATLVSSCAAGAFNQWFERDSDRRMARTRGRAFASGALPAHPAWPALFAAMLLLSTAAAAVSVSLLAAAFVFAGAVTYALIYTVWLKRRTAWNIVIGGAAGSFAALAGAAASDPLLPPMAWALALVLLLWTPPHFWSLAIAGAADYAAAGVPMLPNVIGAERTARVVHASTLALVASSLLPLLAGAGVVYLIAVIAGGGWFLWRSWLLKLAPSRDRAIKCFLASLLQLCLVLGGLCLDVIVG
ncbi:MAG: protoheme IX farnesyltransferase [Xanthomonadales bacterium]|nr:protoheme IX farnesyltransferase [Xanthomonadales bacterium]MCE7930663.1 protoheme IX farnesyltransferase [Xanthomonadales bacterium PRO6]